jgi:hypothetical protein
VCVGFLPAQFQIPKNPWATFLSDRQTDTTRATNHHYRDQQAHCYKDIKGTAESARGRAVLESVWRKKKVLARGKQAGERSSPPPAWRRARHRHCLAPRTKRCVMGGREEGESVDCVRVVREYALVGGKTFNRRGGSAAGTRVAGFYGKKSLAWGAILRPCVSVVDRGWGRGATTRRRNDTKGAERAEGRKGVKENTNVWKVSRGQKGHRAPSKNSPLSFFGGVGWRAN